MLERQLENIPPGLHACAIYRTPAERLQLLVGFFGGGLRQGQQCLNVADRTQAAVRAVELGLVPGSWASQQD